jgi:GAF domain-containing protein
MPFAAGLRQSLHARHGEVASEFERGDSLEDILDRHLLAVEAMAESELLTSILLLSSDGTRLSHGAAPNLPRSYREAIDGAKIGPRAGSCGTAAFLGRPIHVADIATDPLWDDYRHYALEHGLRSCWSTPIRGTAGEVIGTFAIYHRTATSPTSEELEAIDLIAEHVARALMSARARATGTPRAPHIRLVGDGDPAPNARDCSFDTLLAKAVKLELLACELERQAGSQLEETGASLQKLAVDSRRLADVIRRILEA